jgi:hypothetical protein
MVRNVDQPEQAHGHAHGHGHGHFG